MRRPVDVRRRMYDRRTGGGVTAFLHQLKRDGWNKKSVPGKCPPSVIRSGSSEGCRLNSVISQQCSASGKVRIIWKCPILPFFCFLICNVDPSVVLRRLSIFKSLYPAHEPVRPSTVVVWNAHHRTEKSPAAEYATAVKMDFSDDYAEQKRLKQLPQFKHLRCVLFPFKKLSLMFCDSHTTVFRVRCRYWTCHR